MERIRKGNDINITWEIYTSDGVNEYPYSLIGKNIEVIIKNAFTEIPVYNYSINDNVIRFTFGGKSQDHVGLHTITLIENNGLPGMHTVDECNAFILVSHSCQTGGDQEEDIECVNLKFKGSIEIGNPDSGGSGGSINRIDFEVRTVYPTKQTVLEEETFDITEEERAYNIETLSKTLSGKTVFCKVGEAILFPTISMSGVVTEATYSTVVVLGGSLASYSLTITSNGDAEVVIAEVTTGGGGGGSSLIRTIYLGGAEELSEEQKQYNIETRTLAIANPGNVNVIAGGFVGATSASDNTVEVLLSGNFFEFLVCNLLIILEDGTTEYIEQYIYPKVCSLQNSYSAEAFFDSKVSPIPETKGVMNGEDGAQYEVDAYNLESRFVEYNKGDKRYRVMFDESYTIIEEIDITPTGSGGGGSIDPALLEGYMPMMRDFSDDFNDDFAR